MKPRYFASFNSSTLKKCFSSNSQCAAGLVATFLCFAASGPVQAASDTWSNGGTSNEWRTESNWASGVQIPGVATNTYTSVDDATFSTTAAGGVINLGNQINLRSVIFGTSGGDAASFTIGDADDTLNLTTAGGISVNSGVTAAQTIGSAGTILNLSNAAAATAVIANNSTGLLTLAGNVVGNVASGNGLLSVGGSGNTTISGTITKSGAGSNALLKTGGGTLALSNGSNFTGTGAIGYSPATAVGFPTVVREGTLLLQGGTHTITGEAVIGGVVTNGGAGQNAKIQVDGGTLAVSSYLSVGRGNGIGNVSSDLVANNGSVISAANFSAGFNAGNAANLVKGVITLNHTSSLNVSGAAVNIGESNGSNVTMNINDTATFRATAANVKVGMNAGKGTLVMNGGVLNAGSFEVGYGTSNTQAVDGTVTLNTGSTLNSEGDARLGYAGSASAKAVVNINGGDFNIATTTKRWMMIGYWDFVNSTVNINSGRLNLNTNTDIRMKPKAGTGANIVNLNGGAITSYSDNKITANGSGVVDLMNLGASGVTNTFNLNGGVLNIRQVVSTTNNGIRNFNFNGGVLKPTGSTAAFLNLGTGSAFANVRNNGALIDSNGFDVTVAQPLIHSNVAGDNVVDGGLIKSGSGALTLSAANTYTGITAVNAGTLQITGTGAVNASAGIQVNGNGAKLLQSGSVAVSTPVTLSNGTLDGTGTLNLVTVADSINSVIKNGNGTSGVLTIGNLTFNDAATLSLNIDPNSTAAVISTDTLTTGAVDGAGKITVNASSVSWLPGTYELVRYNTLSGVGFSEFTKGAVTGLSGRQSATLVNGLGAVSLSIAGDNPAWTGAAGSNWTLGAVASPKNWSLITSGTPTDFQNNDVALFDDTATGSTSVNISGSNVSPVSTTFNNASVDYSISSADGYGIDTGSLNLLGVGNVAINNVNTYPGGTSVNAGTLRINNGGAIGSGALSLGSGTFIDNTSGSAITLSTNNVQNWNGEVVSFLGTHDLNMGTGAIALTGNRTVSNTGTAKFTLGGVISGTGFGIIKADAGSLDLTGANTYTGATTVQEGTLNLTGSINASNIANSGQVSLGNYGGLDAVLNIKGGTLNATKVGAPGIAVGSGGASVAGVINMSSGTLNVTSELWLAQADTGFGAFNLTGGNVTIGSWFPLARGGGQGIFTATGGSLAVTGNNWTLGSFGGSAVSTDLHAVATLGGTSSTSITSTAANQGNVYVGEGTTAVLTVMDSASLTASGALGIQLAKNNATSNGVVNLLGGTITTPIVNRGAGTGTFNFNGGTLKAKANAPAFMTGLTNAFVQAGGAKIDDSGFAITIAQALVDPTGNGVSADGLSVTGSGYISAPVVQIDGDGKGATALAHIDASGNLIGISMTNPGTGYTVSPIFTLIGGGYSANGSVTGAATLIPNVGGGLTKLGSGTTTLTGANSYSGATSVTAGTLSLGGTGSLGSGSITVNGGKFLQLSSTPVSSAVIVSKGTLDGTGSLNSVTVSSGADNVVANGNGSAAALTVGSLAFSGEATLNLRVNSTSPALLTGALTTGTGNITLNASNTSWTNGETYPLVSYSSLNGTGSSTFQKGVVTGLSPRQSATLTQTSGNIALTIAGDLPVWTGSVGGEWSTASIASPKNWKLQTSGTGTDYQEADNVLFDDSAAGTSLVTIATAGVSPTATNFNNSAKNYTLMASGTVGIASGILTKSGTGAVTLSAANTYAGDTTLNAGTLNLNHASAIGSSVISLNGGTIGNTSGAAITLTTNNAQKWNGDFTYDSPDSLNFGTGAATLGGTGTVRSVTVSSGTLTIDSIPVATGFSLTKAGAGTLSLTGSVISRLSGDLNVTGGVLQIGAQDLYASGLTGGAIVENGSAITRWLYIANATDKVFDGVLRNGSNSGNLGFFKSGNGTLTLTGANDYNDTTTVAAGKLVFSGTTNNTREANVVGNTAASNAVLVISPNSTFGSNYNSGQIYNSSMTVGTNATAAGSIKIGTTGTLTVNRQLAVGTTGYGSLNQSGGSTTIGGFLALGGSANGGVVNQSGGVITLSAAPITIGFAGTSGNAVVNLSGNAVFNVNGAAGNGVWVGEIGTGVLNISGGALLSVPNDGIVLGKVNSSLSSGVVNLLGGRILVKSVSKGTGGGSFNFDGGTLMPNAPNATFMQGLTSAQVFSGGARIDTNGVNITIAQPLLAPTGSGVSSSGLAVSGGGYIDTPIVQISGTGSGATAVASIDSSGNLTAITMTNPGVDYTEVPTFTLVGGGIGNTGSISGTASLVANTSGGLTKSGVGVLTLTGANSYTGDTAVSAGTLSLSNGSLADAADVRLSAGATLDLTFAAGTPDVVDELYIDGVQQANGVWGAIGSGAAHESTSITGTGQLKVTTGGQDAYGTWASAKGLTPGVNDGKDQDPDGDGQNNLGEFAFDSNPLSGASNSKIVGKVATVGANQVLTLTLPVRSGAVFSGATEQVSAVIDSMIYQIQGSDDLSVFDLVISEVAGGDSTSIQAGLPPLSSGWSYRTFRTPGTVTDGDPKDFIRAKVSH